MESERGFAFLFSLLYKDEKTLPQVLQDSQRPRHCTISLFMSNPGPYSTFPCQPSSPGTERPHLGAFPPAAPRPGAACRHSQALHLVIFAFRWCWAAGLEQPHLFLIVSLPGSQGLIGNGAWVANPMGTVDSKHTHRKHLSLKCTKVICIFF